MPHLPFRLQPVPPALCHTLLTPASCSLHFACTSRPSAFKPIYRQTPCGTCPARGASHSRRPAFFHILFFFLCIVINCVLNHFAIKCDLFALAPLGLPLILRKEKLFSLYSLIRQTPCGTCPRPRGFTSPPPVLSSPHRCLSYFYSPRRTLRRRIFPLSSPYFAAPLRLATLDKTDKGTLGLNCRLFVQTNLLKVLVSFFVDIPAKKWYARCI